MEATLALGGAHFTGTLAFLGLGAFFLRVWAERRDEGEFLLFALLTFALATYTAGLAPMYLFAHEPGWRTAWVWGAAVANTGAMLSAALGLHFAMRVARLAREQLVMRITYATTAVFLAVVWSGHWWQGPASFEVPVRWLGLSVSLTVARPSPLASSAYALSGLAVVCMLGVLVRVVVQGRREMTAALVGCGLLFLAVANDLVVAALHRPGLYLTPLGYIFFAYGVSLTLVTRYGRMSADLLRQGDDLKKRTKELRRSYRELQKAQTELVRKEQLAVVGELAAVIAHEVRNPLAIIANAVAGLRRELTPEDRTTLLTIIDEETSRLNRLVGDLLNYARPVNPQRQLIVLRDVVERSLALSETYPGVTIDLAVPEEVPMVWADANLLRQVFDNIVGNALQAMHGDGKLSVGIEFGTLEGSAGVFVSFSDTGEGMDTQVRSRAKTPFFTTRPSGTGLGLAIVDRIVDAHGGTMSLKSRPSEGTTVSVFLPIGRESQPPGRLHRDSVPDSSKGLPW